MLDSQTFYVIVGVVGIAFLVVLLIFDELLDMGELFDFDSDIPWLDLKVLAAGLVGFGAVGFAAVHYNVPVVFILVLAIVGFFFLAFASYFWILKPLRKQEYNSMVSRQSFVGKTGTVTLTIRKDEQGLVQFTDRNGALVEQTATCADHQELPSGTPILIVDVEATHVIVTPNPISV